MHLQDAHGELYDKAVEGHEYRCAGIRYFNEGDYERALAYHELHLDIAKEIADRAGEGAAYASIGSTYHNLGDLKKAIEYHQLHLRISIELGDPAGEGLAYSNLGSDYYGLEEYTNAVEYHSLHLSIVKKLGDKPEEKRACANLGTAYFCQSDFTKAIEYHRLHLSIAKHLGDRPAEGSAYANLGMDYAYLGNFRKAIQYHKLHLGFAQETGDRDREGRAYTNLGVAYRNLGDFKTAIEYHQQHLRIAKDLAERDEEGRAYFSVGNCYRSLGDFKTAIKNYELCLSVAKEVGDRHGEEQAYANLSITCCYLCDFKKAINYCQLHLSVAKEVGNKVSEGKAYSNLGDTYHSLSDFENAIEYHQLALSISREVEDKVGEGYAYQSLGRDHCAQGDLETGIAYHQLHLNVAKEDGDRFEEGIAYNHLGNAYNSLGDFSKAEEAYKLNVRLFDDLRNNLQSSDGWKISLRNYHKDAYTALWKVLLQQRKINEALLTAERGRGRALMDLMESQYGLRPHQSVSSQESKNIEGINGFLGEVSSQTVFLAVGQHAINFWVFNKGKDPHFVQKEIDRRYLKENVNSSLVSLNKDAHSRTGVRESVECEDRSLDELGSDKLLDQSRNKKRPTPSDGRKDDTLRILYDAVIGPIADVVTGNEITIVPDDLLFVAPFGAFKDQHSKYISETFNIRLIPLLTSLKVPKQFHSTTGALLVGDPWVESIRIEKKGQKMEKKKRKKKGPKKVEESRLSQLPAAKREVEMIGQILGTEPLTGKRATKQEVLRRLHSVALVHIAAHGCPETGEIALSPNPWQSSEITAKEDYLLTMKDVQNVKIQAKLVVLSCCHSGRGEIKSESVMGIARAFLGAGARSVLHGVTVGDQ